MIIEVWGGEFLEDFVEEFVGDFVWEFVGFQNYGFVV